MNYKLQLYTFLVVFLLSDILVDSFSPEEFRRIFRGFCPPLTDCALKERDCLSGGFAKDILGCSVCLCSPTPTSCQGVRCPLGQHCETLNRRAGWFSLRKYKCVPDFDEDSVQNIPPFLPFPVQRFPPHSFSSPKSSTEIVETTTSQISTKYPTKPFLTTVATATPITPSTITATTTVAATSKMIEIRNETSDSNWRKICPHGVKPGRLCNKERLCKPGQTCRIFSNLEYGVCCTNVPPEPSDYKEFRFIPRCKQTRDVGPCRSLVPRYFYNNTSGRCEMFIFGGCGNNDNNFKTYSECKQSCENPCLLPKHPGRCRAAMSRVYYDYETNRCNMFYFGGCSNEANGNNWDSFEECYSQCFDRTRK